MNSSFLYIKPLTDVASKWHFLLQSNHCRVNCKQFLVVSLAHATCGIPCTCNGQLPTVHLQWFPCIANFYLIEIIILSSHMSILMKVYEILSTMIKIG